MLISHLFNPRKTLDISNKEHEYGPTDNTMISIKPYEKEGA